MGTDGGITRSRPTVRLDRPWDSHAFTFFSLLLRFFFSFRGLCGRLVCGTHQGGEELWRTREFPGGLYQMIAIPVLYSRMQLALGCGMLNSFTCLSHYLHKVRLDVLITSQYWIHGGVSLLLNFPVSSPLYILLIARVHNCKWRKYALEAIIKYYLFPYIMINVYYSC